MFRASFLCFNRLKVFKNTIFNTINRRCALFSGVRVLICQHSRRSHQKKIVGDVFSQQSNNSNRPSRQFSVFWGSFLAFLGLEDESPDEPESELVITIKLGVLSMQRNEFDKAEQMFHLALKIAQDTRHEKGITYVYDMLANLAYDTEKYRKAEKLFISVMERLISSGTQEDDNKLLHISLKLADIYEQLRDYERAEEGYLFCIHHLERKVAHNPNPEEQPQDTLLLLRAALELYSRYLESSGRYLDAMQYMKLAYQACQQIEGFNEMEETVMILNDLGTLSYHLGDTDEAMRYYTEAKTLANPDMERMVAVDINLGFMYMQKQMFDEAKKHCTTGLLHAKKHEDEDGVGHAITCLEMLKSIPANRAPG